MKNRPTSVTVISWILIVLGAISLVTTTFMINNPTALELMSKSVLPISVQYGFSYVGSLVMVVSGIVMLKGQNWGRLLYIIWSVIGFAVGFFTSPMKTAMIPGLVVFVIIAFFLFRPKANEYFSGREVPSNA